MCAFVQLSESRRHGLAIDERRDESAGSKISQGF